MVWSAPGTSPRTRGAVRGVERLRWRGLTQSGLGDLLAQELCRALPGERRRPPGHGFLDLGGGLHADGAVVGAVVLGEVFVLEGAGGGGEHRGLRSEEHTSELQSRGHLVCRLLLEKKK